MSRKHFKLNPRTYLVLCFCWVIPDINIYATHIEYKYDVIDPTKSAKNILHSAKIQSPKNNMTPKFLRFIGAILGVVVLFFAFRQFLYTYREGNPNWYLIVMTCGMLLILYYSIASKRKENEDDYDS